MEVVFGEHRGRAVTGQLPDCVVERDVGSWDLFP